MKVEKCDVCKQFVKIRNKESHKKTCGKKSPRKIHSGMPTIGF